MWGLLEYVSLVLYISVIGKKLEIKWLLSPKKDELSRNIIRDALFHLLLII